jgi:hypothetical protein
MRRFSGVVVVLVLMLCGGVCGCGPSINVSDPTGKDKLAEVADMLQTVQREKAKPPARREELERVEPLMPQAGPDLRSGDIVYFWGAGLATGGNASSTVLAHEKKVSTEGGWVLMQDGTIKQMSADEFRSAPKAGK